MLERKLTQQLEVNKMKKQCKKCGELKPLTEYYKAKTNRDGRFNTCKTCVKKNRKQRYEDNKECLKEYYEENKGKISERKKEYYKKNRGEVLKKKKQYYSTFHGKVVRCNNTAKQRFKKSNHTGSFEVLDSGVLEYNWLARGLDPQVCVSCGKKTKSGCIGFDHIVPLKDGGDHSYNNLQPMCPDCNKEKEYGSGKYNHTIQNP